jgi:hypothetical protein
VFELASVDAEIKGVDLDHEKVGGGRAGGMVEPGKVCFAGQLASQLGRMETTGKDPAGNTFDESFESSLQTPGNAHGWRD